jgi:acyl phosphate:glycerol-3-phosphate acyltransferase
MFILEIIAIILSYLLGTIPTGLIVTKLFGKGDVRKKGSGNIGATNTLRVAGKWAGLITLVIDCAKGAIPVLIVSSYFSVVETDAYIYSGIAAVLGHMFPVWLNFKGGKGVATTFGVLAAASQEFAMLLAVVFVLSFLPFRVVSIATLVTVMAATAIAAVFMDGGQAIMVWVLSALIVYKHKANIQRLIAGEENKL